VARLGILTGSGGSALGEAAAAGIDTVLTGEASHPSFFEAEELGLNVLLAGHYATETVGVRALAEHLEERFGTETVFVDHPTGF
jgi:putative NIF3 family GTP cyclohydrolase 1 type 2